MFIEALAAVSLMLIHFCTSAKSHLNLGQFRVNYFSITMITHLIRLILRNKMICSTLYVGKNSVSI